MSDFFKSILNWSEVWALLIPLAVLILKKKQPKYLRPIILYLWLALILNITGDIILSINIINSRIVLSNNPLYNIHSIIRFACFSYFFFLPRQSFYKTLKKIIPLIFCLFLIVDFGFYEDFFFRDHISGNLFAMEAFLLLVYCMLFYLSKLKEAEGTLAGNKDFWIVTGLSIYVVANFFVFLFYVPMITENRHLANNMWDVHNVAYIILCIFITKAFYVPASN
ncbi:MAG: hypothetical protein M3015_09400 [Bacteroidota bacterium]|nr:hypothetical protein [Bacteroidota bacterium]